MSKRKQLNSVLLTVKDLAVILALNPETIRRYTRINIIPSIKTKRKLLFILEDVLKALGKNQ